MRIKGNHPAKSITLALILSLSVQKTALKHAQWKNA